MLQLKRTEEVAQGSQIKTIIQAALQAGKSARDPTQVPEIKPLQGYNNGEGGRYSKPDAPAALVDIATQAAMKGAIEPAVSRCMSKLVAMQAVEEVSNLRQRAYVMVETWNAAAAPVATTTLPVPPTVGTGKQMKLVNKMLHQPTMDLRAGKLVDEEGVLTEIMYELRSLEKN